MKDNHPELRWHLKCKVPNSDDFIKAVLEKFSYTWLDHLLDNFFQKQAVLSSLKLNILTSRCYFSVLFLSFYKNVILTYNNRVFRMFFHEGTNSSN